MIIKIKKLMKLFKSEILILCLFVTIIANILLIVSCSGKLKNLETNQTESIVQLHLDWTQPVIFDILVTEDKISYSSFKNGSDQSNFAKVELTLVNIPSKYEGQEFTLVGGGVGVGFHSKNSTQFNGTGYHFAGGDGNPSRDAGYKKDFTRKVKNNKLSFVFYYLPTDIISHWDPNVERYVENSEVTLTLHPKGEWNNLLKSDINQFNWCIAGLGAGNKAIIVLDLY